MGNFLLQIYGGFLKTRTNETKPNPNLNPTEPTTIPYHLTVYGVHGIRKTRCGEKLQDSQSMVCCDKSYLDYNYSFMICRTAYTCN